MCGLHTSNKRSTCQITQEFNVLYFFFFLNSVFYNPEVKWKGTNFFLGLFITHGKQQG